VVLDPRNLLCVDRTFTKDDVMKMIQVPSRSVIFLVFVQFV